MTLKVIIDNGSPPPARLRELIGIERYGDIRYKRRTVSAIIEQAVAAAGLPSLSVMNGPGDWVAMSIQLALPNRSQERFLVCPASVISGRGPEVLKLFLKQARYSPQNLVLPAKGRPEWEGWLLMNTHLFNQFVEAHAVADLAGFYARNREQFVRMEDRLGLVDLSDEITLLEFLSGTFDARFFNAVERDTYTVLKRSSDRAKLNREFLFYDMLPPRMQTFFVRPYDYKDDGRTASYRMERVFVPDMAVQWLHGALSEAEFERFLDHVLYFISIRDRRPTRGSECDDVIESLFVTKVRERVKAIQATPEYAALVPYVERACGSLDALLARYLGEFEKQRSKLSTKELVIGHGDLCFSNILYAKSSQSIRLIDPRGAAVEADIWTHPLYDLAKLSHSIQGHYDFINQDMFDIQVNEALVPQLVVDRPAVTWPKAAFTRQISALEFDPSVVRLCEASLFISMLPLHVDRPRKVLGFILVAIDILNDLEQYR